MPIYGYRCSQCDHELEVHQSMSDEPLRVCPECGGVLRKMLYPVGVQFKGKGFYTTDYKRAGSSASKSDGNGSGDSSKESKESKESKQSKESTSDSGSTSSSGSGSGESGGGSSEKKKTDSAAGKE
jgi:putative FmdB family regulatory protein